MADKTLISWCDSTINPTTGCDGCELWTPGKGGPCYAGNFHERRLARSLPKLYAPNFDEVRLVPGRMAKAAAWSDLTGTDRPEKPWLNDLPRIIFVGDLGDIFSRAVPFEYLGAEVIDVAVSCAGRRHVWMLLTKQPRRMAQFAAWLGERGVEWPANVWAGTSITGEASLTRIDGLLDVPARIRFLSVEPIREDLDLSPWLGHRGSLSLVIVGGESDQGANRAHPCDARWIRRMIRQCRETAVACHVKQLGSRFVDEINGVGGASVLEPDVVTIRRLKDRHGGDWSEWPEGLKVRQMPRVP